MSEYLLEPHAKLSRASAEERKKREREEETLGNVDKLERELSVLQNRQINQYSEMIRDLDQNIEKCTKNLSTQKRILVEQEGRESSYAEELANTKEETSRVMQTGREKIERTMEKIRETKEDIDAMLAQKERHQKAQEALKKELNEKYEAIKKLEGQKFQDAESIYKFKKLLLTKQLNAMDAEIENMSKAIESAQKLFGALKSINRGLWSKYYRLKP